MKGGLILYHTIPTFKDPKEEGFGKHSGGKGENTGKNSIFSFSHSVFYSIKERTRQFSNI